MGIIGAPEATPIATREASSTQTGTQQGALDMTQPRRSIVAVLVLALVALGGALAGPAAAQEFAPAIVFDMGGKFDKSFNEAAFNGAERFKKETGIAYREFEVTSEAQREQALRNMARRGSQITV